MSNGDTYEAPDGRQTRSFSQGSAASYFSTWLSNRFSPSASTNDLRGDDDVVGDLEYEGDEGHQR